MDLSSRGWPWKTPIRSGLRTDGFDARKNEIYLEWRGDEHLQTRGHVMIHSDRPLTGDSQGSDNLLSNVGFTRERDRRDCRVQGFVRHENYYFQPIFCVLPDKQSARPGELTGPT